jgi:hypothetical protein
MSILCFDLFFLNVGKYKISFNKATTIIFEFFNFFDDDNISGLMLLLHTKKIIQYGKNNIIIKLFVVFIIKLFILDT